MTASRSATERHAPRVLALLCAVAFCHTVDKIGFSMMLQPVKEALHMSDRAMGMLGGPAFAFFNAAASLPLACLADRVGRPRVLAVCVACWSLSTALAGAAPGWLTLATTRVLTGVAESGASPISQSLVAEHFSPTRRSVAFSILLSAVYAGMATGFWGGGVLLHAAGWRGAFVWLGAPGLVLAALVWRFAGAPASFRKNDIAPGPAQRNIWRTAIVATRDRKFVHLTLAVATASVASWGMSTWLPAYYMRRFGMSPQSVGLSLAVSLGIGAIIGALVGGALSDTRRRTPSMGLWIAFWSTLLSAPLLTIAFVTREQSTSLFMLFISTVLGSMCAGPVYATLQSLSGAFSRATLAAFFGVATMIIGQGLGPILVGELSYFADPTASGEGLRVALLYSSLIGFWPAWHFYALASAATDDRRI